MLVLLFLFHLPKTKEGTQACPWCDFEMEGVIEISKMVEIGERSLPNWCNEREKKKFTFYSISALER